MAAKAMTKQEFYDNVVPVIVKLAKANGYHVASPIIAQAACESNWGKSSLAYKYNNFFGMKCGSKWKGKSVNMKTKEEYTKGTLTTIKDNFRAYDSIEEGIQGYFDFINTKRYANLKTARTPKEYLEMIKADGYATSSTYVQTNMNIIEKNGLAKYDADFDDSYAKVEVAPKPSNNVPEGNGDVVRIKTNGSNLRIRMKPSTNCAVLGYIPNKTEIKVLGLEKNDWYKVEYKGVVGYIYRAYTEKI